MRTLGRLVGYLRPYLGGMILATVLLATSGALMAAVVATVKPLVNRVLLPAFETPAAAAAPRPAAGPDILARLRALLPEERLLGWAREHRDIEVAVLEVRAGGLRVRATPGLRGRLFQAVPDVELSVDDSSPSGMDPPFSVGAKAPPVH